MSTSSFNTVQFVGVRIAGQPEYTPAHIGANGKPIRQMIKLNVYQNNGKKKKDDSETFRITGWGSIADTLARSGSTGKELTLFCEASSYKAKVTTLQNGNLVLALDANGVPIETTKVGFVIRRLHYGPDSDNQITFEIEKMMRPPMWNVKGSPDNTIWEQIKVQRNNLAFDPNAPTFGFAKVSKFPGMQLVDPKSFGKEEDDTVTTGTAQYQKVAPVYNQVTTPQYVAQPQYAQNPAQVRQVLVNGVNMGYAPPTMPVQPQTVQQPQYGGYTVNM